MTGLPLKTDQFKRPDPILTNKVVTQLKSQGIFDEFRRECMADVDTKPAYQNLRQRVEGSVAAFLKMNPWRPDMNKNQLRDNLRKHIQSGGFLDIGVDRIVDQVVNPKIYTVFLPKVEEVVQNCLGMNKDKPKPIPSSRLNPEPAKFQNKHNLAPRAALTGPRMPSLPVETLKPMESAETREEKSSAEEGNSPNTEKPMNERFVMDDEEVDDADDDEESPPFEPHSESDRLILGVRTDTSDSNSSDNQVVTTIVDDNLEERIDNNDEENNGSELVVKDEREEEKDNVKKEDDFTSDDSVPKTPTINMESSDGTLIEFDSISEYKRYHNKFGEDSIENVEEEIEFSQWGDVSGFVTKEERNSNHEESCEESPQKRKLNFENFDDRSSSSFDKSSSCDEEKSDSLSSSTPKKVKLEDDNETVNELFMNDDSNTDKYSDMSDIKNKLLSSKDRSRKSSSTSKEGRSHSHHHSHTEQKDSLSHYKSSYKVKHAHKDNRERESLSSHSSRDKHDKKESSKEREKSKDSLHKHHSRESKSKCSDKDKETDGDKKKIDKSEVCKRDKSELDKDRKESRHRHETKDKSRFYNDKEKKKHDNHDNSDTKKEQDSSHKNSSDRRDSSKHYHSSSKHGHRSSSNKHRSDKAQKHKHSPDKYKSQEKNAEKDSKHDLKKKQKDYCKSSNKDFEGRRSSDRDSNGPSGTTNFLSNSTYRSGTYKSNTGTTAYSSDKITPNSDNSASEHIEPMQSLNLQNENGIASPDPEINEDSWNEFEYESDKSKDLSDKDFLNIDRISFDQDCSNENMKIFNQTEDQIINHDRSSSYILSSDLKQTKSIEIDESSSNDHTFQELKENVCNDYKDNQQDIPTPVHDTSSEKENIDVADSTKESENTAPGTFTDSNDKTVKFKKPKIAANIFEVRKIMQERRHLKRMEKKRIKLLMKNNTTESSTPESSPEVKPGEQEMFLGFDYVPSKDKLDKYDSMINRLKSEISTLTNVEVNPNLITSLIEVDPSLDDYIESTLKGKVHRKFRVRLPPISEDCYKYDAEQNAYILMKNACEFVDSNLNNLNPILKGQELCNSNISNDCIRQDNDRTGTNEETVLKTICDESISPKSDSENQPFILQASLDSDDSKSPTCIMSNNTPDDKNDELNEITELEDHTLGKVSDDILSLGISSSSLNDISATPQLSFSLTFNQTYDDILKEREQNSEHETKQLESKFQKPGSTVVKITNNNTTEQVILKKVELDFVNHSHVPKISRSESVINGKLTNSTSQMKQPPLIRRINKSNNVALAPSSSLKSQCLNGVASPDSTNYETEVALPDKISSKTINDVIGIVGNQRGSAGETWLRQRDSRGEKQDGMRQRYSSSDLYKPRLQLTSRRVRGQCSPESAVPSPPTIRRKRAAVTPEVAASVPKRRR